MTVGKGTNLPMDSHEDIDENLSPDDIPDLDAYGDEIVSSSFDESFAELVDFVEAAGWQTAEDEEFIQELNLPPDLFSNDLSYIETVRRGLPGKALQHAAALVGKSAISRALDVDLSNWSRQLKRPRLTEEQSEVVLDTLELYDVARQIFGGQELAEEWMTSRIPAIGNQRPSDLVDTFRGRSLIRNALLMIKSGDYIA